MDIVPPKLHWHLELSVNAGAEPTIVLLAPGAQGAAVIGVHGMGVRTPIAAAVAEATAGLAMLVHMAKGKMFTNGLLSMILAAGGPDAKTLFTGSTTRELGAAPNEHIIMAPATTCIPN